MAALIEWLVERVERESEDIVDVEHHATYASAKAATADGDNDEEFYRIGLVRDAVAGRSWAYMEDGELPDAFEDAYGNETVKVPARYRAEVAGEGA